jgi:hypothetical protein
MKDNNRTIFFDKINLAETIISILTILILWKTFNYNRKQDAVSNSLAQIQTELTIGKSRIDSVNLQLSKNDQFAALIPLFIKGSAEEQEYALILMNEVDSVLTYRIISQLIETRNKGIQPVLSKVLKIEALDAQKTNIQTMDPKRPDPFHTHNKAFRMLENLNKKTSDIPTKKITTSDLNEVKFNEHLSIARLFYKNDWFQKSVIRFQLAEEYLPATRKISTIDRINIKSALSKRDTALASKLYYYAFTNF